MSGCKNSSASVAGASALSASAGTQLSSSANAVYAADSRHPEVYSWTRDFNGTEVPLVQWSMCLLRPHNCYPSDMPILWDFLEHYSMDENGTRYYSASAFELDDAVVLE